MKQFGSYIESLDILASCRMAETNPWGKDALERAMTRIERVMNDEEAIHAAFQEQYIYLHPDLELGDREIK